MVRAKTPVALFVGQAAEYVRMSTEHQQYSPTNQLDVDVPLREGARPLDHEEV